MRIDGYSKHAIIYEHQQDYVDEDGFTFPKYYVEIYTITDKLIDSNEFLLWDDAKEWATAQVKSESEYKPPRAPHYF